MNRGTRGQLEVTNLGYKVIGESPITPMDDFSEIHCLSFVPGYGGSSDYQFGEAIDIGIKFLDNGPDIIVWDIDVSGEGPVQAVRPEE